MRAAPSVRERKYLALFAPLVRALDNMDDNISKFPYISLQFVLKRLMKFVPE